MRVAGNKISALTPRGRTESDCLGGKRHRSVCGGAVAMSSTQRAEALFDFEPTAEVELKMQKGEVVMVKRMSVGEGWWEGELNGRRGLFPSSYVKLLPAVQETPPPPPPLPVEPSSPLPPTPLTPHSTKKAFMDTMLAPEPSTLDDIYDEERAREVFIPGYNVVAIEVGPKWKGRPPTLTVIVKEPQTEPRFSGMKHVTLYDVDTKELGSCVTRKYKHFLWLYDRLAEYFPCISLPPLPVKQGSGQGVLRKGLEKFLRKVAHHPVLGCTRFIKVFLTDENAKSDKEWKIGKHLSHMSHNIKLPKTSRKLFHAPVYCTVKYPPYNVPISQLASIEKFSRFSRLLESNINTLHVACRGVTLAQRDMVSNVNLLAKDLKCFARGTESTESTGGAHRRKLQAKLSVSGPSSAPLPPASIQPSLFSTGTSSNDLLGGGGEGQEESSGGEEGGEGGTPPQWNWREDEKFNSMASELLELASGMQRTSRVFRAHQEAMEAEVMETLQEYSGTINTFPGLVRLHEEAMEYYNSSKNKDSRKEAEEVRQNCETLNNVLLSEFDYFSEHLVDDFEAVIQRLLHQQSNFYRKLADEWETLHTQYIEHTSHHRSDTPMNVFSSPSPVPPPTSQPTSASSHPQLHNLNNWRTPSDIGLSSSGETTHSQDDVGMRTVAADPPPKFPSQSQSHPNIHSLGHAGTNSQSTSNSVETDLRPTLTNSSDSYTETATTATTTTTTPPTEIETQTSPRSYVNFDIDELRNEAHRERRLRSLSPLELSIERELERTQAAQGSEATSSGSASSKGEMEETEQLQHPYANWQFEKMNEKQQKAFSNTHTKPVLNGASLSGSQDTSTTTTHKTTTKHKSTFSSPKKTSLKPPSPFRLQNLSDLTALNNPPGSLSTVQQSLRGSREKSPNDAGGGVGKAVSTSKLYEVSPTDDDASRGLATAASQSTRHVDRLLPSQLNLGGHKPRSYTTSYNLSKKKPVPPPGKRASSKSHPVKVVPVVTRGVEGVIEEVQLESSGELERSFERKAGQKSGSTKLSSRSFNVERERETTGAAALRPSRQSSPSNELLRKLSLRRQRIEQQLGSGRSTPGGGTGSGTGGGDSSSRCTSTSSTQSELVCSYNVKRSQEDDVSYAVDHGVELRLKEDATLAKYGIMEDIEGGSYEV